MNAADKKNYIRTILAICVFSLICLALPNGVNVILVDFNIGYALQIGLAICSFTIATVLAKRQKRLSLYAIGAGLIGGLFLVSGTLEYGYGAFIQNLPRDAAIEFTRVIRPEQISRGLANLGVSLMFIFVAYNRIKQNQDTNKKNKKINWVGFFFIGAGIFMFALGIYSIINGFRSL